MPELYLPALRRFTLLERLELFAAASRLPPNQPSGSHRSARVFRVDFLRGANLIKGEQIWIRK